MAMSFTEIMRIRSELAGPESAWSPEARAVMEEAKERCRLEDQLIGRLNGSSVIATYAPRLDARLNAIEKRLDALERRFDKELK